MERHEARGRSTLGTSRGARGFDVQHWPAQLGLEHMRASALRGRGPGGCLVRVVVLPVRSAHGQRPGSSGEHKWRRRRCLGSGPSERIAGQEAVQERRKGRGNEGEGEGRGADKVQHMERGGYLTNDGISRVGKKNTSRLDALISCAGSIRIQDWTHPLRIRMPADGVSVGLPTAGLAWGFRSQSIVRAFCARRWEQHGREPPVREAQARRDVAFGANSQLQSLKEFRRPTRESRGRHSTLEASGLAFRTQLPWQSSASPRPIRSCQQIQTRSFSLPSYPMEPA